MQVANIAKTQNELHNIIFIGAYVKRRIQFEEYSNEDVLSDNNIYSNLI